MGRNQIDSSAQLALECEQGELMRHVSMQDLRHEVWGVINDLESPAAQATKRMIELKEREPLVSSVGSVATKEQVEEVRGRILETVPGAYRAYQTVLGAINAQRYLKKDKAPMVSEDEFQALATDWLSDGPEISYVAGEILSNPHCDFILKPTPNIAVSLKEVYGLADSFGEKKDMEIGMSGLISIGGTQLFTDEEASGTDLTTLDRLVRFNLVPDKLTPALFGSILRRARVVEAMRQRSPFLNVPTPFESIAGWFANRELGLDLNYESTYDSYASTALITRHSSSEPELGLCSYVLDGFGKEAIPLARLSPLDAWGRLWVKQVL